MLRTLRAALVIAILWTLFWVPFGLALEHVLVNIFYPPPRIDSPYMGITVWVIWGALSGLSFAAVLSLGERGHVAATLSARRVLWWGTVGSLITPILYSGYMYVTWPEFPPPGSMFWLITAILVAVSALLGAICATFTLALMRESLTRS